MNNFTNFLDSEKIYQVTNQCLLKALEFLTGDLDKTRTVVSQIVKAAILERKIYEPHNLVWGGLGMLLAVIGAVGILYMGFKLLAVFFGEGFEWGLVYLANFSWYFSAPYQNTPTILFF